MRKIVYYVATSLDGFISGPNDDISGFAGKGNGVDQYLKDLEHYDTVIMGRKTYEFGYKFGLEPGQPAYQHMEHYLFSNSLEFENQHSQVHVCKPHISTIRELVQQDGTDIYLCGGGEFAGWLLDQHLIDILKIKLNPLLIGEGVRMFGNSTTQYELELLEGKQYEYGLQIISYQLKY